jgi:hypothetical protein
MSHKNKIRKDKTCLNCNHVVAERFCPNCGQENIETRKTFSHLFIHFFEDLTHYENAFWKTIKNLLLRPASLTKEYLSGKRMSYLAPVRLYIFISFITFFIISLLPNDDINFNEKTNEKGEILKENSKNIGPVKMTFDEGNEKEKKESSPQSLKIKKLFEEGRLTKKESDTLISYAEKSFEKQNETFYFGKNKFKSIKELDSIQKYGKYKMNKLEYWLIKKLYKVTHNKSSEEVKDKFLESFQHNLPKALFIFMPIFAFLLWLFHSKKRWYYFDHGIFTLHYFSFLLTIVLLYNILDTLFLASKITVLDYLSNLITFLTPIWAIVYFYRAHKKFYNESGIISFIKSSILFFLNFILILFIILCLVIYSFINIH